MAGLTLYTYYRSSAAYRVRIALNLKGITYHPRYVHLTHEGGQHHSPEYQRINPQALVPTLVYDDGDSEHAFTQSMAIIEYLDELYPEPPLLPDIWEQRAQVRALAQLVCCDIHPLNNLRVLKYLEHELGINEAQRSQWYHHWIHEGLKAFEQHMAARPRQTRCCLGNQPTLADICLIPQIYNAKRFNCDLAPYPTLMKIYHHCMEQGAFQRAAPENQEDNPER